MAVKSATKNKSKKGNKHATNTRRRERKSRNAQRIGPATAGKCGSSFCTAFTGCQPWKTT